jgi:hypothetical protein
MKNAVVMLAAIVAVVLLVFAFISGVYPRHDYAFSTFLVVWALAVVWLGGLIASWLPS